MRVNVLCPNGRREIVNLTPNSSVLQILEDACCKQKLNPDDYDICHYNKRLDLTLPVRFASLGNNAQLELKPVTNARHDALVTIALQLESGERITRDFKPSLSLWDVIEQSLDSKSLEDYKKKGELICIYMRQKLAGEELRNTTLRSLGLTKGSAIIRLSYKNEEATPEHIILQTAITVTCTSDQKSSFQTVPKSEVPNTCDGLKASDEMECDQLPEKQESDLMQIKDSLNSCIPHLATDPQNEISVEKTQVEQIESISSQKEKIIAFSGRGISLKGDVTINNEICNQTTSSKIINQDMVSDSVEDNYGDKDMGAFQYIGDHNAVIYSLDDVTEVKKADLPDGFFELTTEDIKYLMEQYKKTRLELENEPLLTQELRNQQLLKRLGRYKQTVIRVNFPERLVLQAVFDSSETVQDVQDFVKEYLENTNLDFYLYTAPPKEKKDPTKSLIESMLIPAAVVYFGCNKQLPSYLSRTLRGKISDPRAAAVAAYKSRQQAVSSDPEDVSEEIKDFSYDSMTDFKAPGPSSMEIATKPQSSEKIPKWLKLSKK